MRIARPRHGSRQRSPHAAPTPHYRAVTANVNDQDADEAPESPPNPPGTQPDGGAEKFRHGGAAYAMIRIGLFRKIRMDWVRGTISGQSALDPIPRSGRRVTDGRETDQQSQPPDFREASSCRSGFKFIRQPGTE
jgi:hypothetical protein